MEKNQEETKEIQVNIQCYIKINILQNNLGNNKKQSRLQTRIYAVLQCQDSSTCGKKGRRQQGYSRQCNTKILWRK